MKKLIASLGIAAALGGGAFALNTVLPAGASGSSTLAATTATACAAPGHRATVVQDALDGLVQKGTITKDQEDAIFQAIKDTASSERANGTTGPRGRRARAVVGAVKVSADTIGVTPQELVQDIRNGQSIADVAKSKNVDPNTVVQAIVTAGNQRIDQAVTNGRLTQDQASKLKDRLPQVADRIVNHVPKACTPPADGGSTDSTSSSS
jgi:polyhydroxyalkanoate synthesis regulator phasin